MKNLKINAKLLLGFGIVACFIIILGIISFVGLAHMNGIVQLYAEKTVPNTRYIDTISQEMVLVERYLAEAIATADEQDRSRLIDRALEERQRLTDAIDVFNQHTRTAPSLMEAYQQKLDGAQQYRQQILDILQQPYSQANQTLALSIYKDHYTPIFDSAADALSKVQDSVMNLSEQQDQESHDTFNTVKTVTFFVWIFSIAFTAIIIVLIRRSLLVPIHEIKTVVSAISVGRLDNTIRYQSKDEYGMLASDLRSAMQILQCYISDIQRAMGEMAVGNFDLEPSQPFIGDFQQIEESISQMIVRVCAALIKIEEIAGLVSSEADQVACHAQTLAQGTEEQASAVQELSASAQEISSRVQLNAKNTDNAYQAIVAATELINSSNEKMQQLVISIRNIDARSHEIRKISKTIEDIAFQTNILALNAAVEAARAGEVGKGFAVVADEVRNLAAKSAEAAQNTVTLIEDTVQTSAEGVTNTEQTAEQLNKAVASVLTAAEIIAEITAVSAEQSQAISQVTSALEQFSAVVQVNSASSEESAAASQELLGQAELMKTLIGQFKLKRLDDALSPLSSQPNPNMQGAAIKSKEKY